jgi:hypothetical protein
MQEADTDRVHVPAAEKLCGRAHAVLIERPHLFAAEVSRPPTSRTR